MCVLCLRPTTMRPERPLRSGAIRPSAGIRRELGARGMTIDPEAKQDVRAWTTFTQSSDIPDWISRAYISSYRGPHDAGPDGVTAVETGPSPAALVTPAVLGAHYRLGEHRPADESCVAVYPADDPAGFGPALPGVTHHRSLLMDSNTVLLHRLGVFYTALITPVFERR